MLDKQYVLGLVDGEGSFNIRVNQIKKRAKVELKFSLKLRHQDKEILDELQKFLDVVKSTFKETKEKITLFVIDLKFRTKRKFSKELFLFSQRISLNFQAEKETLRFSRIYLLLLNKRRLTLTKSKA